MKKWIIMAAAFIICGFALDGITEIGHHALLILGGVAVGIGIGREAKNVAPGTSRIISAERD